MRAFIDEQGALELHDDRAVLFEAGLAHVELGEAAKARERLKQVIDKYPQSNEASRARLKLADLK